MKKQAKKILYKIYYEKFVKSIHNKSIVKEEYQPILERLSKPDAPKNTEKEREWLAKWRKYDKSITSDAYKVFSLFTEDAINVIPYEVLRAVVEPVLTPYQYVDFYSDKNSFDILFNKEDMPRTLFRCMNGVYYDGNYVGKKDTDILSCLDGVDEIIIKPTKSNSGRGIVMYHLEDGEYKNSEGAILDVKELTSAYHANFIIQERFHQGDFMAQFNPSSVNTIRMAVYRSPKTGELHTLRPLLRIGAKGSVVDNNHSGGMYTVIDDNGKLCPFVADGFEVKRTIFNDIDFEHTDFIIPNLDSVKSFVKRLAMRIPHMHLMAFDVALDKDNQPKLIEVNTYMYGIFMYQLCFGPVFREYTDEILDYCLENHDKLDIDFVRAYNK